MSDMFAIERSIRMPVVRLSHASDIYKNIRLSGCHTGLCHRHGKASISLICTCESGVFVYVIHSHMKCFKAHVRVT